MPDRNENSFSGHALKPPIYCTIVGKTAREMIPLPLTLRAIKDLRGSLKKPPLTGSELLDKRDELGLLLTVEALRPYQDMIGEKAQMWHVNYPMRSFFCPRRHQVAEPIYCKKIKLGFLT